jgi:hypothetical protein
VTDSDQQLEIEAPEELLADMPLPSDAKTFFLGGIFFLAILATAYVASDIVLPMIFAIMLNLLMQPALRALERLRAPRAVGALLLILVVIATIVGLGAAISGPARVAMTGNPSPLSVGASVLLFMIVSAGRWFRTNVLARKSRTPRTEISRRR